jgi:hypothetical protein
MQTLPLSARLSTISTLVLLVGCWGNKEVEFPPGLEPLAVNKAPWPEPTGSQDYPETIELISGEDEFLWAHARGYVHADLTTTWEALRDPDVNADRRRLESWEVSWDVPQEYDYCYRLHVVVVDLVTLEWDIDWNHGVINGSLEEPEAIGVRWFKSEGSSLIDMQAGSIAAYALDDETTAIEVIYQIDAPVTTEQDLLDYVGDLYIDVVAWVHGEPLPSYD